MDPTNDVILAMEMNDFPLPPDHGYTVRMVLPGMIGGRCVKRLGEIWVSEHENTSHSHIWDTRSKQFFITDKESGFAKRLFNHPSTACYEHQINSVITRLAQGEETLRDNKKTYQIQGYAY